tara:strand:- start:296 stop:463 length:168 start_codon:yes stop_codon:yes gene_type:complete
MNVQDLMVAGATKPNGAMLVAVIGTMILTFTLFYSVGKINKRLDQLETQQKPEDD